MHAILLDTLFQLLHRQVRMLEHYSGHALQAVRVGGAGFRDFFIYDLPNLARERLLHPVITVIAANHLYIKSHLVHIRQASIRHLHLPQLFLDDMIARLTALKITEIEMSRGEFMLMKPPTDEMCRTAKPNSTRPGFTAFPTTRPPSKRSGSGLCGAFCAIARLAEISGDATGDMVAKIDERLSKEGLTFGIHNHYFKQKFAYESPDDVLKALAGRSKTMGSTLDVGHIASCGLRYRGRCPQTGAVSENGAFERCGRPRGGEDNVLLGQGIAKIPAVMEELHKVSYRGLVPSSTRRKATWTGR